MIGGVGVLCGGTEQVMVGNTQHQCLLTHYVFIAYRLLVLNLSYNELTDDGIRRLTAPARVKGEKLTELVKLSLAGNIFLGYFISQTLVDI